MTDFSDLTLRVSIGVQLKRIRRARGKDIETVAELAGMSVQDVEAMEEGRYDGLCYEAIRSYVRGCGTDCWDIVDEAKLVSQVYALNQLLEEFLGQDLSRHDMAAAISDVICKAVRTAYHYREDAVSAVDAEREIIAWTCSGLRTAIDSRESVPDVVPLYGTVPVDDLLEDILAEVLDGCDEYDDGIGDEFVFDDDDLMVPDDDPPVIVPDDVISDQDSADMEVGADG